MNNRILSFIITIMLTFMSVVAMANRYVYLQGDQKMPFVVEVEGYALPKLGQHYCIIPNLEPGVINVKVTFQSGSVPVHKFKIRVPEHSSRGLILSKVSNNSYVLFDMQTQAYISNNNKEDDAYLEFNPENFASLTKAPTLAFNVKIEDDKTTSPQKRAEESDLPKLVKPKKDHTDQGPAGFLEDLDLNNSKKYKKKDNKKDNNRIGESTEIMLSNEYDSSVKTQCPEASSIAEFEDFSAGYVTQSDDTDKLKFIRKNKSKICLSTQQIHILSSFISGQSSKFELFDMLKNDVVDKENYHQLSKVFTSDFMKEKFQNSLK